MNTQKIGKWLWAHRARVLVMLVYFFAGGTAVSILYAGFLNGDSTALTIILGTVGGILLAAFWIWQLGLIERGETRTARAAAWALVLIPCAALLILAISSYQQLNALGRYAPRESDYVSNYNRLARAIDANYPYFEMKQVNWPETSARYLSRVQSAQSDPEYHAVVADLLAELNDGHTNLNFIGGEPVFGALVEIEGQAVLSQVGAAGTAAGMKVGDVVQSVGGLGIDAAIQALPAPLRSASTPEGRRRRALANLLRVPPQGSLAIEFSDAAGQPHSVTLVAGKPASPAAANEQPPFVSARRLPSGIGVITISRLWGEGDPVAEFDRALDGLMDAPALILDLRGNGGGDSRIGDAIAGRFLSESFVYGVEYYRHPLPQRFWRTRGYYRVEPRLPLYAGPLALITDLGVFSSAEQLVVALKDSGRAVTVGQTTGAGSGNPISFRLIGGRQARFSTGAFYRNNGDPIEGLGITPDVPVSLTLAAFRAGEDQALQAAETLLTGQ